MEAADEAMNQPDPSRIPSELDERYRRALKLAREGGPGSEGRRKAVDELRSLLVRTDLNPETDRTDQAWFLLGSFLDDATESHSEAIAAYRKGLDLNPFFAPGHNNLGVLLMDTGQLVSALGAFKIAIQLEPDYTLAYRNLARLFFDRLNPGEMENEYASLVDEFGPRAPAVLSRLSLELIDLGRTQVYDSLYSRGHQLKNLLGLTGNRLRRAVRGLPDDAPGLDDLRGVCEEQERIYEQWVDYLRTMKQDAMNPSLLEMPELVKKAVDSIRERSGGRQLAVAAEEAVPDVTADAGMIAEVVVNLVANAIEATDANGQISVQTGFDAARNTVYVEVEDDGPGIPQAEQVRVFDTGFSTKTRGNGYGLSICERIVSAHQGSLRVISREGEGSVFRFDLPTEIELGSNEESVGNQGLGRHPESGPTEEFVDP